MFGACRTILAIFVLFSHLGGFGGAGALSVYIFYTLSGFLMTLIMHESYGYDKSGRLRFAKNRFLRLYPIYWISALFSLVVILLVGSQFASDFHGAMLVPNGLSEIVPNLLMIFPRLSPTHFAPRLLPATWALTVELFFYLLICLGISKTFKRSAIWVVISMGLTAIGYVCSWDTYSSFFAASLPFSLGAVTYFLYVYSKEIEPLRNSILRRLKPFSISAVGILFLLISTAHYAVTRKISGLYPLSFYATIFFAPVVIFLLAHLSALAGRKFKLIDKTIGDYSYCLYIIHWPVGLLVAFLFGSSEIRPDPYYATVCCLISIFIAFLLLKFIDAPIQKVRKKIKHSN